MNMSKRDKRMRTAMLAMDLAHAADELRTTEVDGDREILRKQAIGKIDEILESDIRGDTREHAKRVRSQIERAFERPDRRGRPRGWLLDEAAADAASLVGAIDGSGRAISDFEKDFSDPEELVALILKDIQASLDHPGKGARERRFPRVRKAAEIIHQKADYLDDETRDVATAVWKNFAEANAWHGWSDNGETATQYLQVARDHANTLRDAIRAHADDDARPARRGP